MCDATVEVEHVGLSVYGTTQTRSSQKQHSSVCHREKLGTLYEQNYACTYKLLFILRVLQSLWIQAI